MTGLGRILAALLRQRRRLALATVAIALSIGYLAGALTLLDRVGSGLDRLATSAGERADLVVEGGVAYESPLEKVRRLVPAGIGRQLAEVPGVASVSPRVEDIAVLVGPGGMPLVAPGLSEQPIGANWPDDDAVAPWELLSGRPPRADDEVVIDERSAEVAGVGPGDSIGVAGKAKVGGYRVVGVVRTAEGGLPAGASLALFTTDEARALFDRPNDDNTIAIRLERSADAAQVEAAVRAMLPGGIEVVDGDTAAQHRQEALSRSFALVRALVVGFAGLALLVGMATVSNSLSLLHSQRRLTFAELRLVGARRRQLLGASLVEAALLAVVASVVGLPAGVLLGRVIEAALGALDTAVPVAGGWISWRALATAVVVGIASTVVAAVVPAVRACRVAPVEAVSEVSTSDGGSRRRWWIVAAVAGAAAVAAGVVAGVLTSRPDAAQVLRGEGGSPDVLAVLLAAVAAAAFVAAVSFLPVVLARLVSAGVSVLPVRPAPLRRIASRDVARNRSRTAATTGALILAAGVVAGLAVFLSSFSASVKGEVDDLVVADLVVDSGTFTRGGLPGDLLERIGQAAGVQAVSGWQVGRGSIAGRPVRMTGLDLQALDQVVSPAWEAAPDLLDGGTILMDAEVARATGHSVGDLVPVTFTSGGTESLRLAGTYGRGSLLLGDAVVDRSVVSRQVPATTDIAGLVKLGTDRAAGRAAVRSLASDHGIDRVLAPEGFVDSRAELLRGFEGVVRWMLLFTLLQALVGVVNTLLLSVGERRREIGLLRAAGATRRQVLRLVLLEGTSLAVVGTVAGLALGVAGAAVAVRSLSALGLDQLVAPLGTLAAVAVAAVTLGVLAAVAPARWAAGVPPLDAVADQGGLRARPRPPHKPRWHRFGRPGFHFADLTVPVSAGGPQLPPPYVPPVTPVPMAAQRVETPPPFPGVAQQRPQAPTTPPPYRAPAPTPPPVPSHPPVPPPAQVPAEPPPPAQLPAEPPAAAQVPVEAPAAAPVPAAQPQPLPLGRLSDLVEGALAPGEEVRGAVAGVARGLPCAVALTDRRVLVVAERQHRPLVQSLHPSATGLSVHRTVPGAPLTLVVLDGNRMLELSGVHDPEAAVALADARR